MADGRLVLRELRGDVTNTEWCRLLCQEIEHAKARRIADCLETVGKACRLRLIEAWSLHGSAAQLALVANWEDRKRTRPVHEHILPETSTLVNAFSKFAAR